MTGRFVAWIHRTHPLKGLFAIWGLIAAWTVLCGAMGLLVAGCSAPAPEPTHEPWMVYESGWVLRTDYDALTSWLMDQARCGTVGSVPVLTITLNSGEDATPRRELLLLAKEAQENLPPRCPITVEVQTLEDAIAYEDRYIKRCREDIARLRQIHGEEAQQAVQWVPLDEEPDGRPLTPAEIEEMERLEPDQ